MISININPDTAVQLIVGVGSTVLAALLMLIKIPQSEYSVKLTNSKMAIVMSFLICSFMMFYSMSQFGREDIWDWEMFMMLSIYIVVHFSTAIISYSMIALLKTEKHKRNNLFVPGLFVSAVVAFMLLESYKSQNMNYFWFMCIVALTAFLIQSITYIVYFDKAYKHSVKELENYYDEDESHKLKWVKFCYVITMLTNLFILVYLCLYWFLDYKMEVASLYTIWYLLYMLYLSSNFISFLGSHKLVLDAVAHKVLDGSAFPIRTGGRKKKEKQHEPRLSIDREFDRLDKSVEEWVERKLFCEYDKTRDQVAAELNTTKEVLNLYFSSRVGVDFRTWRTNLRIEEAKKLLLENEDASLNIIAEASGFSDKSNFHRQFVKIVGCSPRQWRDSGGKPSL
ncbi:MAG: AraC family transcriptional regulator [Bacteroidales bacterium]|nr:AraC family transcriptional regulator [Bacteroidales bacterium]